MPETAEQIAEAENAIGDRRRQPVVGAHVIDAVIDLVAGTAGSFRRILCFAFVVMDFVSISGGIANVYAGQPLDTVKVKMQTFPHLYTNSVRCLITTFQKDGIRGLYAGMFPMDFYLSNSTHTSCIFSRKSAGAVPALAANVAENALLFAAYGFCQKGVALVTGKPDVHRLNPVENACAGSLAAVVATFGLCPTELVKCRLQAMREMQASTIAKSPGASSTSIAKLYDANCDLGFGKRFGLILNLERRSH